MKLLLDTHVFLWWLADDPRLGKSGRRALEDGETRVFVSAASIWEIAIKAALGKLRIKAEKPIDRLADLVERAGFDDLPITAAHAAGIRDLPPLHADPFDRMLVSQARLEEMLLVTADSQLMQYDVARLDIQDRR